jgi:hypothetical protein
MDLQLYFENCGDSTLVAGESLIKNTCATMVTPYATRITGLVTGGKIRISFLIKESTCK